MSTPSETPLVASGLAPLDARLGGFVRGRPHLISGGPGAGKSISCLEFVAEGLRRGERCVLLTHDDPADVLAASRFLGHDLGAAMREDRLVVLRYQLDFVRAFGRAASPDEPMAELRRLIGEPAPARTAVDSVVPLLEGGGASTAVMFSLVGLLDDLGTTSLLTYPGDLAGLYDKRLEPLMQRAAGVFHLAHPADGRPRRLETRKLRFAAASLEPIPVRISAGRGLEELGTAAAPSGPRPRSILVVDLADPCPPELVRSLEQEHQVVVRSGARSAADAPMRDGLGALLLTVRRDVIADALRLVHELRSAAPGLPIVLVTRYRLRSADRTRALRAGADDFLETALPPAEFAARVSGIVSRGRSLVAAAPVPPAAVQLQPTRDGRYVPLDLATLQRLVQHRLEVDAAPFFTLLTAQAGGTDGGVLAEAAIRSSRMDGGDLVAADDAQAYVLLDAARPKDLKAWHERFSRAVMEFGGPAPTVTSLACPEDEVQIRDLLAASAPAA